MNNYALKTNVQKYLPYASLIIVIVFFEIVTQGKLLQGRYLISLTVEIFTILVGTTGLAFLLAQGCLDFSLTALVCMAAAFAAKSAALNQWLIFPVAVITGLLLGCINGIVHAVFKVNSFIATLAMSFICSGFVMVVLDNGNVSIPHELTKINTVTFRVAVMLIVAVIGYFIFEKTRVGKETRIIGSNPEFARQNGISLTWVKIRGFMIMGGICGIVAIFELLRAGTTSSSTGSGFTVNVLNALLIGGMPIIGGASAKFRSAVIGSIVMAVLTFGMNLWGLEVLTQQFVKGIVFLVAICLTFDRKNMVIIK